VFFWLGIVAQSFLAGAGMFVDGSWLRWHEALGHLLTSPIPLIPLLLLILSIVGRMPVSDRWLCAALLILATVQPVVLYLRGVLPLLSALHPVIALLLFALPLTLIGRVRRAMRGAATSGAPVLAALLLCLVLGACGSAAGASRQAPVSGEGMGGPAVHMQNVDFTPPSITIPKDQSLTLIADTFVPHIISNGTWEGGQANRSREPGAPQVTELNIPGNQSGSIGPFATAGTFQFYCTIHPKMNLTVVVE
jgi:plastocyanin